MNFRSLNLIWIWNKLNRMEINKWYCATGLSPQYTWPGQFGKGPTHLSLLAHESWKQGSEVPTSRMAAPVDSRRRSVTRCRRGAVEEHIDEVGRCFCSGGEEGSHRTGLSTAEWISCGEKVTATRSGGHRRGWKGRWGAPELGEGRRGGTVPGGWS
jgi:hypothetical protein